MNTRTGYRAALDGAAVTELMRQLERQRAELSAANLEKEELAGQVRKLQESAQKQHKKKHADKHKVGELRRQLRDVQEERAREAAAAAGAMARLRGEHGRTKEACEGLTRDKDDMEALLAVAERKQIDLEQQCRVQERARQVAVGEGEAARWIRIFEGQLLEVCARADDEGEGKAGGSGAGGSGGG